MVKRGLERVTPGMRVRLTAYFLRASGQELGGEGASVWTVVECSCDLCTRGTHCATDEVSVYSGYQRHLALCNVEEFGKLPKVVDMADAHAPLQAVKPRKRSRK